MATWNVVEGETLSKKAGWEIVGRRRLRGAAGGRSARSTHPFGVGNHGPLGAASFAQWYKFCNGGRVPYRIHAAFA